MSALARETVERIEAFLASIGAEDIHLRHPSHGHPRICYRWQGIEHHHITGASPSCPFTHLKAIADIKRKLGLHGLSAGISRNGRGHRRRSRRRPIFDLELTPLRDWKAMLALHPLAGLCGGAE